MKCEALLKCELEEEAVQPISSTNEPNHTLI